MNRKFLFFIAFCMLGYNFSVEAKDLLVYGENGVYYMEAYGEKCRCSVGRKGITDNKLEGDSFTPSGTYPL